jgi:DNA ligase-associated metallophosphoesterase
VSVSPNTKATATLRTEIAGEPVILLAQRALFWPSGGTLFIADPHFGKSAAFRHFGIAAPDETESDLQRLDSILDETAAEKLVVLGDFFHARVGRSKSIFDVFLAWRKKRSALEIVVVRGNHDRSAGDPPLDWNIHCVADGWKAGPYICHHEPCGKTAGHVFCGHIHPAFSLRERSGMGLRAPCFAVGTHRTIFPAVGSFTGLATIEPEPGDRIFAMNGEFILRVWG